MFCYTKFTKYVSYCRNVLTLLGCNFSFLYSLIVLSVVLRFRRIIFFCHLTFYWARERLQLFDLRKTFQSYICNYNSYISYMILCVSELDMLLPNFFILVSIWYTHFNIFIKESNIFLNFIFS